MEQENSTFPTPTGPYATPGLVGRTGLLRRVDDLLQRPAPQPATVLFLTGDGGIGKTRFLRDVLERAGKSSTFISARQIIDLYHIRNHTTDGLIESICAVLPSDAFAAYQNERAALERMRLAGDPSKLGEQHKKVFETFAADLRRLAADQLVVIVLDTAEKLLYATSHPAQGIGDAAESWQWLGKELPTLPNVVLLVAGRPESEKLQPYIAQENVAFIAEEIPLFSVEDSLAYFNAVLRLDLAGEAKRAIGRLTAFDESMRRTAAICAGGLPITLALLLDFLSVASASEIPEDLMLSPSEAEERVKADPTAVKSRLHEAFVRRLVGVHSLGGTILALGRLPKGADAELLAKVMGIEIDAAKSRLAEVRHLSIVKIRPADQRYFLHDLLYEMLNGYVYGGPEDTQAETVSQNVVAYYDGLLVRVQQKITDWFQPVFVTGSPSAELLDLAALIVDRQAILSEILYYRLRQDPVSGFQRYYRYMREAILSGQSLLDLLLQTELLAFWHEKDRQWQKDEIDGLSRHLVESLLIIRPITRAWAEGQNEEAIRLSAKIRTEHPEQFASNRPVNRAIFDAWEATARIHVGGEDNMKIAYELLGGAIDSVAPLVEASNNGIANRLLLWRQKAVLAFAYRWRGYLLWARGDMQKSLNDYVEAIHLWRDINLRIEYARSLNDLGFVRSELGEVEDARAMIQESIRNQTDLGQYAMAALSINALALVELRDGNFEIARKHSLAALAVFRSLGYVRGEGLALIALADSSRPLSELVDASAPDASMNLLRQATQYAEKARDIFSGPIREGSRQIEALNSLGCAQRDWARLSHKLPSATSDIEALKAASETNLRQAANLAGTTYTHQRVMALVNLAWLGHFTQDDRLTEEMMAELENLIPQEYKINPISGQPSIAREEAQILYWPQMGKLHMLSGIRDFEQYQELQKTVVDAYIGDTLSKAVQEFTLGLEYNALYSPNFLGIEKARQDIYERFKELSPKVLRRICDVIRITAKQYGMNGEPQIQQLLKQRILWYS